MNKETWKKNLPDEAAFWQRWCETQGELWHDDYLFRLNEQNQLQEKYLPFVQEHTDILDCGSGMYTVMGRNVNGKRLDIKCIDALAYRFSELMEQYNLPDIDDVQWMTIENADSYLQAGSFDFVHAQNCLDHSYNPVRCLQNMVKLCKPGGVVYTFHEAHEGKNEAYNGLHKWDFTKWANHLWLSTQEGSQVNISKIFDGYKQTVKEENGWITYIIYV